jgi:hypothetical protein
VLQAIHGNGMGGIGQAVKLQQTIPPQQQVQQQLTSQQPAKKKGKKL